MIVKCPTSGMSVALFNSATYSRTTSRHQSYARSAASHLTRYTVRQCDLRQPRDAADLEEMQRAAVAERVENETAAKTARLKRAKEVRQEKKRRAETVAAYPAELAAWRLGGPTPRAPFVGTLLRLSPSRPGMIESSRSAFVPVSVARKAWPILAAAVQAEEANPNPAAWVPFFSRPDWNWGDYKGLSLRRVALGSPVELVVGCHCIPWAEVQDIAGRLGM